MITAAALNAKSVKELGKIAERYRIGGWRSLSKDALVKAIVRTSQLETKAAKAKGTASKASMGKQSSPGQAAGGKTSGLSANTKSTAKSSAKELPPRPKKPEGPKKAEGPKKVEAKVDKQRAATRPEKSRPSHPENGKATSKASGKPKSPRVMARIQSAHAARERQKSLATVNETSTEAKILNINGSNGHDSHTEIHQSTVKKDRIVLLVRDAFWLQTVWELTRQSVERAQVALAQQWHSAKPVLRLIELEANGTTSSVEQVARVIPIHGGVNTWFIDITKSPRTFRVDIGYMAANGKFFSLARSNSVTTPRPGSGDGLENNWSDIASDCEKIYALSGGFSDEMANVELQEAFEERLGRPMGGPSGSRFGVGADKVFTRRSEFQFDVDAEMIIFGRTRHNARVTLAGNPIKLRPDGSFAARLAMPDRRQVLPIVASSADGVEQRTVVIAVERNTKVMEPMVREASD